MMAQCLKQNPEACPLTLKMGNNFIQKGGQASCLSFTVGDFTTAGPDEPVLIHNLQVALEEALDMVQEIARKQCTFYF